MYDNIQFKIDRLIRSGFVRIWGWLGSPGLFGLGEWMISLMIILW